MNAGVSLGRCVTVWLATVAAAATVVALGAPVLAGLGSSRFDDVLVGACAAAGIAATGWLWVATSVVVIAAVAGRVPGRVHGVPEPVRRAVLAACGLALVGGALAPSAAADDGALDGLPLPDRAVGSGHRPPTAAAETSRTVSVRPGDSLWSIAAADLPPAAGAAQIERRWRRVHELNRGRIGPDPELIHPGQQLRLPHPRPAQEPR